MKELKPMIHDEKNGLDYILVGDVSYPVDSCGGRKPEILVSMEAYAGIF